MKRVLFVVLDVSIYMTKNMIAVLLAIENGKYKDRIMENYKYWVYFKNNWIEKPCRVEVFASSLTQAKILAQAKRINEGKNYTVVRCDKKD